MSNLKSQILKAYENGSIYNYDLIFVTDLFLDDSILNKITNNLQLFNKFFIFDHHESAQN